MVDDWSSGHSYEHGLRVSVLLGLRMPSLILIVCVWRRTWTRAQIWATLTREYRGVMNDE